MFNNILSKLRRQRPPEPAPAEPLAIIGDVHGRADLLGRMLARIAQEAPDARPVLAGDMIDRGPDSCAVLTRVRALDRAVVLRGNHEEMMVAFLDSPAENGGWLRHGGDETLRSFGIAAPEADTATRDTLRRALPAGTEDWLRALPCHWISGNVAVVHAGADPRVPIPDQNPRHLLWGHPGFGRFPRRDGLWVVHGHTIVGKPRRGNGVISIDTGAWRSGRLSAVILSQAGSRFLTVGP